MRECGEGLLASAISLLLGARVVVPIWLLLTAACPAPPPISGCRPGSTRCSPDGARPQRCSPERRWFNVTDQPCSAARDPDAVCCLAPNAYPEGGPLHACVPVERCMREDGAAVVVP